VRDKQKKCNNSTHWVASSNEQPNANRSAKMKDALQRVSIVQFGTLNPFEAKLNSSFTYCSSRGKGLSLSVESFKGAG
jgi:hypothetical protein